MAKEYRLPVISTIINMIEFMDGEMH